MVDLCPEKLKFAAVNGTVELFNYPFEKVVEIAGSRLLSQDLSIDSKIDKSLNF